MMTSCVLVPVYFMPMPVYFMPMPVYFMPMPVYFMPVPAYSMPVPAYSMPVPAYSMPMQVYFVVSVSLYFLIALMLRYTRILILHLDPKCIVCFIGITVYYFSLTLSAFKVSKDVELRRNITKSTKANNWTRWEPKGRGCRSGRRGQRWKRSSLIFYFIIQQKFPSPQDVIKKSNYYFNKIHKTIFSCNRFFRATNNMTLFK